MAEYVIETSDGEVHVTSDPQVAAAILDRYGPEVISHHTIRDAPDGSGDKALTRAVMNRMPLPNPRSVGSVYP